MANQKHKFEDWQRYTSWQAGQQAGQRRRQDRKHNNAHRATEHGSKAIRHKKAVVPPAPEGSCEVWMSYVHTCRMPVASTRRQQQGISIQHLAKSRLCGRGQSTRNQCIGHKPADRHSTKARVEPHDEARTAAALAILLLERGAIEQGAREHAHRLVPLDVLCRAKSGSQVSDAGEHTKIQTGSNQKRLMVSLERRAIASGQPIRRAYPWRRQ